MRIPPVILSISLVAVLAGSLILAAPFSIFDIIIPKQSTTNNEVQAQQAEAQTLPLMIRDRFTEKRMAGDAAAAGSRFFKVDENFVDPENHCEFCTRVEYTPGSRGIAGFAYEDLTGLDLSNARKAQFWVMGEEGDERIRFKLAGKSVDRIQDRVQERVQDRLGQLSDRVASEGIFTTERFALTTQEVRLDNDWKKYEVDLTGIDLRDITHPFAFELSGNGNEREVIYIKGVVYDEQPAEDPLETVIEQPGGDPLEVEVFSNGTEGVAPAVFEFEANITGGTGPYSISWDFDDDNPNQEEGQNVIHTFEEAGQFNVTVAVSDADGQETSSSIVIRVAESDTIEEERQEIAEGTTNNDTRIDANMTDTELEADPVEDIPDEQNPTEDENQTITEPIEVVVDAGMDIVAQSGDSVVLGGEITRVDVDAEDLILQWEQISGPAIAITGGDSLNPTITIPELGQDAEIELELAVSIGSIEDRDSATVFVQSVEGRGALEELLTPAETVVAEWVSDCDDQAHCMGDDSDDTFSVSQEPESVNLFSFEEFDIEDGQIAHVKAMVMARADGPGYLLFVGADADATEDQSETEGAISIHSSSFEEYEFTWEENPITRSPWTVESLNSFLAGYSYGDGQSNIEVSEFRLIVSYTTEEQEGSPEPEVADIEEGEEPIANNTLDWNTQNQEN